MGTASKNSCKTAAVMSLLGKGSGGTRPVSNLGTTAGGREQIEYIDIDRIDDDPNNFYELSGLEELAANIELLGLQQPVRVRPGEEPGRYVIVSGHRRRAAVRLLIADGHGELRDLPCVVDRREESPAMQELRLILANSDTRKLTNAELGRQAERLTELFYQLKEHEGVEFPGRIRDHVAEACGISKSKLARLKVIRENLAGPWQGPYEKGKLPEATAYILAQMPGERQQVIWDGMAKNGEAPSSAQGWVVNVYGQALALVDKIECKTWAHGPCINREAMRERVMSQGYGTHNYCRQCCENCEKLTSCKSACPLLADKVKQLKADDKARRAQEKQAKADAERPKVEQIQALWKRFGEARAAAGKTVEECFKAEGRYLLTGDAEEHEKRERLEGTFREDTALPYSRNCYLGEVQRYVKLADLLGVSLDYLLCRTDDPAGLAPQPEGQLVFNGWMSGGAVPGHPCDVVVDFDFGDGVLVRELCKFNGADYCFTGTGSIIDAKPVRWMMLPPDPAPTAGSPF